jgi:hypothetical protein
LIQKMTIAAMQMAEKKVWAQRSPGSGFAGPRTGSACVDAAPVFELAEHVLDLVALTVERAIMGDRYFAVGF